MESSTVNRVFFVTGAESTGKSTLTAELADHYGCRGVPEYARAYLEQNGPSYGYEDVENIARRQVELIRENSVEPLVFFDTCLINLKVWFQEVFQKVPGWLEARIPDAGRGIYLVCQPDLPWQADPLRENPHRRDYLNDEYERELKAEGFPYFRVSGTGPQRLENAIKIVDRFTQPATGHQ